MKQAINILILFIMNTTVFSQSWVNTSLYPFENKYLRLEAGNMHYVDKGQGDVILFVHGTPTWSFLYRDFIKELSEDYRCIAIDHLGFGLSDKPDSFSGTPEWHSQNLSEFINKLNLKNITLVVHDFGGPIGLTAGIENSERIDKVVLFNTWLWSTEQRKDAQKIDNVVHSKLGRFMYLNLNFSPKVLLKKGFANKKYLTKEIHQQYILPFPDKTSRIPLLDLAKALVGSSDWYQSQWKLLHKLEDKEWLIIWGTEDKFITSDNMEKWQERIPNAKTTELKCGHFVQEEATEESIQTIRAFMNK
jgi:pimeloyl-ACP methyl ester carboxylesterase